MAQQTSFSVKSRLDVREPDMYDVVMLNDDFTTMEFVVEVLTGIFYCTPEQAETLMMRIHRYGQAVVGTYVFDVAMLKAERTKAAARERGFPLSVKVQPHK